MGPHPAHGGMEQVEPPLEEILGVVRGVALAPQMGLIEFGAKVRQPLREQQKAHREQEPARRP